MREWKRDLTIQDLLALAIGATLALVHHGLAVPLAHRLKEAGL